MRAKALVCSLAIWLFVLPAHAAPTCLTRQGETVRCEAANAMPVGWKPSPQEIWDRELSLPPGPGMGQIIQVFLGIGLFLVIIALMPKFDGRWDRQEEDERNDKP